MSTSTAYKDLFEYEELEKIHGEPDYMKLKTLHDQLKANAASVPSDLGGGANGHLGLVLTVQQYGFISLVPFVRPLHPGPLIIPEGAGPGAIEILKYTHDHALEQYRKIQAVEKTLIQQLSKAVDKSYLEELRNQATGLLQLPLSQIIQHLKTNYGRVQSSEYKRQYQDLTEYRYNTDKPIDQLFNKIQDFNDLAEATGLPQSASQSLHMGTEMIKNCGTLTDSLKDWNRTPVDNKTWNNFKLHFREAQKQYRETMPTTIHDPQHQANLIAQQVTDNLLQQMYHNENQEQDDAQPSQEEMQHHSANAVLHDSTLQNLYTQIRNLTQTVNNMQIQGNNQHYFQNNGSQQNQQQDFHSNNNNRNNRGGGRRNNRGGGRRNDRGGRGRNPFENTRRGPMPRKYCWTHGNCAHNGYECDNRAHGHLMNATFNNRLGGNNAGCNSQQQQQQQGYQQNQPSYQQQQHQGYQNQQQQLQPYIQPTPYNPYMAQPVAPQGSQNAPPPPPPNQAGFPPFR